MMKIFSIKFNLPTLKLYTYDYHIRMPKTNVLTTMVFYIAGAPLKKKISTKTGTD